MKTYKFNAEIKKHPSIDATFIEFPYDVKEEFGVKGQVKVIATFDGYEYRGSLAKMGHHCHMLGITQKIRKEIGKGPGDTVGVILRKDDQERVINLPEELEIALTQNPKAKQFFDTLSYTNKKEYVQWISSAKKQETKEARLQKAIEMLLNNVKRP